MEKFSRVSNSFETTMSSVKNPRLNDLRRWEDLDPNILKNIFKLVSLRDLFCSISWVCPSWQLACWDTLFWSDPKTLDLTGFSLALELPGLLLAVIFEGTEKVMRILERLLGNIMEGNYDAYGFPLERWRQSISKIVIPKALLIPEKHLLFVAERTSGVESVMLFGLRQITIGGLARAMCCWKKLTHFAAGFYPMAKYTELIGQMGKSCPQLTTLEMHGSNLYLGTEVAQVIAKSLPRLTTLRFENSQLYKEGVEYLISSNCSELNVIHFCKCYLVVGEYPPSSGTYTFDCRSKGQGQDWEWYFHSGYRFTWDYRHWFGNLSWASD